MCIRDSPDTTAGPNTPLQLNGSVANAQTAEWKLYSGPGQALFSDAARTNTTVTFSTNGTYTLILKAADDIHTPAFDALQITVGTSFSPFSTIRASRADAQVNLSWDGPGASYSIQETSDPTGAWNTLTSTTETSYAITATNQHRFFRVLRN